MSGAGIAAEALAGIKDGLASVGPASAAVIIRNGPESGPSHNPTAGTPEGYACTAIGFSLTSRERVDNRIIECDRKFMVGASDLVIEPAPGDKIQTAGEAYLIEAVEALRPADVVIYWTVYAKSLGAASAYVPGVEVSPLEQFEPLNSEDW